jgi:Flp pilus assembly protein TadG
MFKRFRRNTDGNVAMMFSGAALTLIIGIGAAVDFGSASSRKQNLQDMIDAATLAAAKSNSIDVNKLQVIADSVVARHNTDGHEILLDVQIIDNQVHISGATVYDTHILGVAGKPEIEVVAYAASPIAGLTPIKLALVLDTTESMDGPDIAALKTASNTLLNELEDISSPVAVSVVPFGQYVNIGTKRKNDPWLDVDKDGTSETKEYCYDETRTITPQVCTSTGRTETYRDVRDGRDFGIKTREERACTRPVKERTGKRICEDRTTTYTWYGCVGSRQAPYNEQAAYGSNRMTGVMNKTCGTELQELTTSLPMTRATIGDLEASGNTYLPSGVMWGWRTLQDELPLKTKLNYKSATSGVKIVEASKVMIFMTDGANTLTQGGSEPHLHEGNQGPAADARTLAICTAAKREGINIFTVGYRMAEATGDVKSVLQGCATNPSHYFDAANASELENVFKDLAGQLGIARLSM